MRPGFKQRHDNDINGLTWIFKFGWLRTAELGRLMWPQDKSSRTRADRVLRGWIERKLVLVRPLPDGAGRAVLLSGTGAELLRQAGLDGAHSGKDWGGASNGKWSPPGSWKHDLLAAGVLAHLYERGLAVQPEVTIRRLVPMADRKKVEKWPDGFVTTSTGQTYWLEVENSRKSGPAMTKQAQTITEVAAGQYPALGGVKPTHVMVAYPETAFDERGAVLDHRLRVLNAVAREASSKVALLLCSLELEGAGVSRLAFEREPVQLGPDLSPAELGILERLNERGWSPWQGEGRRALYVHHAGERVTRLQVQYVPGDDGRQWAELHGTDWREPIPAGQKGEVACAKLLHRYLGSLAGT